MDHPKPHRSATSNPACVCLRELAIAEQVVVGEGQPTAQHPGTGRMIGSELGVTDSAADVACVLEAYIGFRLPSLWLGRPADQISAMSVRRCSCF